MATQNDPRIYFASERTLLAWVRTGLTVVGLGFVVAKFNLFLKTIHHDHETGPMLIPTMIGISLVLLGSAAIAVASWQHYRYSIKLAPDSMPGPGFLQWSLWFAGLVALVGLLLAFYLMTRATPS